jgi:hypothetical protein
MKLTSDNVEKIFKDCLFGEEENTEISVIAEGILFKVGFHPDRLEKNKPDIIELINQLPEEFSTGGGWSFIGMCNDKESNQWTGLQKIMDELLLLGVAIGKIIYCIPRDFWKILPGGMPYIRILEDSEIEKI